MIPVSVFWGWRKVSIYENNYSVLVNSKIVLKYDSWYNSDIELITTWDYSA